MQNKDKFEQYHTLNNIVTRLDKIRYLVVNKEYGHELILEHFIHLY